MRSLKPLTVFIGGSVLLTLALAAAVAVFNPDMRNPRAVAIWAGSGAVFGIFLFGSIAGGEASRSAFVRRHFDQLERWSSFIMALGLGHWMGAMVGRSGIAWAFAFVFLGACFRTYLSGLAERRAA